MPNPKWKEEFDKWFREVTLSEVTSDSKAWKRNYTGEKEPERNDIKDFIASLLESVIEDIGDFPNKEYSVLVNGIKAELKSKYLQRKD